MQLLQLQQLVLVLLVQLLPLLAQQHQAEVLAQALAQHLGARVQGPHAVVARDDGLDVHCELADSGDVQLSQRAHGGQTGRGKVRLWRGQKQKCKQLPNVVFKVTRPTHSGKQSTRINNEFFLPKS